MKLEYRMNLTKKKIVINYCLSFKNNIYKYMSEMFTTKL